MAEERRRHERFPIVADVRVAAGGGPADRLAAHDISLSGVFLRADLVDMPQYPVGALCDLAVFPSEDSPLHREGGITVHGQARVVRHDPGNHERPQGLGMQFEALDEDNEDRLRALVRRSLD
jgi:hypothetical protein